MAGATMDPRRALRHEDPLVRIWGLSRSGDAALAREVAAHDPELGVRLVAAEGLDPVVCGELLLSGDLRCEGPVADEYIVDPDVLDRLHGGSSPTTVLALTLLVRVEATDTLLDIARHAEDPEVRLGAVRRIEDPEALAELVEADVSGSVTREAVDRIFDQRTLTALFSRLQAQVASGSRGEPEVAPWTTHDFNGRNVCRQCGRSRKAVDRFALACEANRQVASHRSREDALAAVLDRIDDEAFLEGVVVGPAGMDLKRSALGRIGSQERLQTIASTTREAAIAAAALERIDDEAFRTTIALEGADAAVREAAILGLGDEALAHVAERTGDPSLSALAMSRLRDEAALVRCLSGVDLPLDAVREAIDRLEDPAEVERLSRSAAQPGVREYAARRLQTRVMVALRGLGIEDVPRVSALLGAGWPVGPGEAPVPPATGSESTFGTAHRVYRRYRSHTPGAGPLHLVIHTASKTPLVPGKKNPLGGAGMTFRVHAPSTALLREALAGSRATLGLNLTPAQRRAKEEAARAGERADQAREQEEYMRREVEESERRIALFTELFGRLLEAGADPNHVDAEGVTPLHLAMQIDRTRMPESLLLDGFVRPLLTAGARPDTVDAEGRTPLQVAVRYSGDDRPDDDGLFADSAWSRDEARAILELG